MWTSHILRIHIRIGWVEWVYLVIIGLRFGISSIFIIRKLLEFQSWHKSNQNDESTTMCLHCDVSGIDIRVVERSIYTEAIFKYKHRRTYSTTRIYENSWRWGKTLIYPLNNFVLELQCIWIWNCVNTFCIWFGGCCTFFFFFWFLWINSIYMALGMRIMPSHRLN